MSHCICYGITPQLFYFCRLPQSHPAGRQQQGQQMQGVAHQHPQQQQQQQLVEVVSLPRRGTLTSCLTTRSTGTEWPYTWWMGMVLIGSRQTAHHSSGSRGGLGDQQ
jgi:hypothetical protein